MALIDLGLAPKKPDYEAMRARIQADVFDVRWRTNRFTVRMLMEEFNLTEHNVKRILAEGPQLLKQVVYQPDADYFIKQVIQMDAAHYYAQFLDYSTDELIDAMRTAVPALPMAPITANNLLRFGIEVLALENKTYNLVMRHSHIRSVNELLHYSPKQLTSVRYLSPTETQKIQQRLTEWSQQHGIDVSEYPLFAPEVRHDEDSKPTDTPRYTGTTQDPVSVLEPNVRAHNALRKWGVQTIEDLLNIPYRRVETTRHVGVRTRNHLWDALHKWAKENDVVIDHYPFIGDFRKHLNDPIETLRLNDRAYIGLTGNGIETVDQLLNTSSTAILHLRGLGPATKRHIHMRVRQWGEHYYIPVHTYPLYTSQQEQIDPKKETQ